MQTHAEHPAPRVAISCLGRFHAYNLAEYLQRHGALTKLITSHPKFNVTRYGIAPERIVSAVGLEVARRLWWKMPRAVRACWNESFFFNRKFDRFVVRNFPTEGNVYVGFWTACLQALRKAKAAGMPSVLDFGNSHPRNRERLLEEQSELDGRKHSGTHPSAVDQELAECEEADYITVASQFARRSFLEQGVPAQKLFLNPYGVSLEQFQRQAREDKTFRVIQCAQVSPRKGSRYLLQAFTELNLPGAELWLVGGVTDEGKALLASYRDSSRIRVFGGKPQAKLAWYYSQCDVSTLASIEDGFGMVLMQAMACELPLIATTNTGGPDIIQENRDGFVVPIRDVEALKEKILWCYENREACREMGRAARQRVEENFTWDHYGQRALDFYRQIAPR